MSDIADRIDVVLKEVTYILNDLSAEFPEAPGQPNSEVYRRRVVAITRDLGRALIPLYRARLRANQ